MLKAWIHQGTAPLSPQIPIPLPSLTSSMDYNPVIRYWVAPVLAISGSLVGVFGWVHSYLAWALLPDEWAMPIHFGAAVLFVLTAVAVVLAWYGGNIYTRWTLEIGMLLYCVASLAVRDSTDTGLVIAVLTNPTAISAIGFALLAGSLLFNHWNSGNGRALARFLSSIVIVLGLTAAIGRAYHVPVDFLSSLGLVDMAWLKLIGMILLALSIIWLHPDKGLPSLLYARTLPATQLRLLLPAVVILPVLFGYFLVHYGPDFGTSTTVALVVLGSATFVGLLVIVSSAKLSLAESALFLREHALAATSNGVFIADHRHAGQPVVWINRAFTTLTGYSHGEVIGKSCPLFTADTRGQEDSFNELQQAMRMAKPSAVTIRHRCRDSRELWVRLTISPVSTRAGVISHVVGVVDDVTEDHVREARLRETLRAVEQAQADAESALAARDTFVSFVSHELRSPLNAALTWVELLQMDASEELLDKGLEVLRQSIFTQTRLIDDLTDVVIKNAGCLVVHTGRFDIRLALQNLANELRPEFESRGMQFDARLGSEPVWINGDPVRILQVARNLLANARHYNVAPLQVTLTLTATSDSVTFAVTDTGIGMSQSELAHSFEPFWRGQQHKKGLGIGLAIVRAIVEAHGGSITAFSDGAGKGISFSVTLPVDDLDTSGSRSPV